MRTWSRALPTVSARPARFCHPRRRPGFRTEARAPAGLARAITEEFPIVLARIGSPSYRDKDARDGESRPRISRRRCHERPHSATRHRASPPRPKRSFFCLSFGISFHAVSRRTPHALAAAAAMRKTQPSPRCMAEAHGTIAPVLMEGFVRDHQIRIDLGARAGAVAVRGTCLSGGIEGERLRRQLRIQSGRSTRDWR